MSCPPSNPSSPSTDSVESWKRKYNILEERYALSQELGLKAKNQKTLGRGLRRVIDMFYSARDLVQENDRHEEALGNGRDASEFTAEQNAMIRSYEELVARIPLVKTLVEQGEVDSLEALYKNLRAGSDMARGDDANNLKAAVVTWVNDLYGPSDPVLKANSKDERGLANNHTGRLLCPGEYCWDDESVRTHIRDGHKDYVVDAHSWPIFCYANFVCDNSDIEKGLWKSALLVKAFKSIFTSPSSATNKMQHDIEDAPAAKRPKKSSTATRSDVTSLIGLTTVTPRAIAYTAVQLHFALSNANTWRVVDVDFDHMEFYRAIIDYFDVTPGPVARAHIDGLLAWWNRKVFGRVTGTARASSRRAGASVSRLQAQRKTREDAALVSST
ncbi:hypothetical protein PILCRDRAFT_12056 [Piloderma croceum F 1598]|uniref:Uncharacterized protein n=1 Tax=Piloderma croceum (strain F 1598) TaxID=765440 RepID=A0A0C3AU04_PILCF|nr:hypothetical protein PILCRDRAFT_12056 [Piloderma croceum F 1598]